MTAGPTVPRPPSPTGGPRPARPIVGRVVAGIAVALSLVTVAACSGGSGTNVETPSTIGPQSSLAESKGFRCVDPKGDLSIALTGVGTLTEPAGVDMVVAEAKVDGDNLVVTYQMAGDPVGAPQPFVTLLQGDIAAPDYSFELRAEPISGSPPGTPWGLTLVTFKGTEQRRALNTAVVVQGDTITYSVPLSDIPPIATLQWTFGSASTAANKTVTFDDCNSFSAPPAGSDSSTTSPP